MAIEQNSDKLILNWDSFNIGNGQSVTFQQLYKSDVALNRVIGPDPSSIHGQLNANGKVFLVNPNGVLFGKNANVNVGGIVASTLDIANQDFLDGNYVFAAKGRNIQGGEVVNQGLINAHGGGVVALLGGKVSNQGTISAQLGSVALAAGNQVSLDFAGDGLLKVHVDESSLNALVENSGQIVADGGTVRLTAAATEDLLRTVVNNQGAIQARSVQNRKGKIELLASGGAQIAGKLDASAVATGEDGGLIVTSGDQLHIAADTTVTTQASKGSTGSWLIETAELSGSADMQALTDVNLQSFGQRETRITASAENGQTALKVGGKMDVNAPIAWAGDLALNAQGDINVNAPLAWSQGELTLAAGENIYVNAVMTARDTAALQMNHGGYCASHPHAAKDTGIHMGLSAKGFTGRVDFTGKNAQGASNNQLKINGANYTLITALGSEGSRSGQDLQGMNGHVKGHYALAADIDASATKDWNGGFMPIGGPLGFTGTFDGLGHVIHDLHIHRPKTDWVGLFGEAMNATLRNVGLKGGSVKGRHGVGALVGKNEEHQGINHISRVYSSALVEGGYHVGGLVGGNFMLGGAASISDAYFMGKAKGFGFVGGLVGYNTGRKAGDAHISRVYSSGMVEGNTFVGGLVGKNLGSDGSARISDARFMGTVKGDRHVGGLVGENIHGDISRASSSGTVEGNAFVGGLVGENEGSKDSASISDAHFMGTVKGKTNVGGLVGKNIHGDISRVYSSGTVEGIGNVGGLVGLHLGNYDTASISDAYSTGAVKGNEYVGELFGAIGISTRISNSYFDRDSTGQVAGNGASYGTAINSSNRYQHASYADFGDWSETASGSGIWQAKDAQGSVRWIMFEGSTRPFLASEYSTNIGNAHQLQLMAYKPDAPYQLAHHIDARATQVAAGSATQHSGMWGSAGFVPVGNSAAKFTGSLNGQGHSIHGLNIDRPQQSDVGLFGHAENASLSELNLEGRVKGFDHVGLLVGKNVAHNQRTASVLNANVSGQAIGLGNSVGGLVGSNRAKNSSVNHIDNVHVTAVVAGGTAENGGVGVGGVAGKNYAQDGSTASISNAVAAVQVTGGRNVGGLAGIHRAKNNSIASIDKAQVDVQKITGSFNVNEQVGVAVETNNSLASIENVTVKQITDNADGGLR